MTHASLFSGIGGPEVAAQMLGWQNLFHCEINPFGRAVLEYHFPESISYEDITKTDFTPWRGRVDVLTGGFPCQPFSYAGKRGGADDDRYLWPEMCRAIQECQPTWVVGENVAGLATMVEQGQIVEMGAQATLFAEDNDFRRYRLRDTYTIQRICKDLEGIGYEVQPVLIPACAVGAPHRRDRVFIIGHRNANLSQDPVCGGQLVGRDGEQGSERDERDAGARGGQRLRGETSRTAPADAADLRQGRTANPGAESELSQTIRGERCRAELYLSTQAARGRWPIADTAGIGGGEIHEHMEPELAERNEPVSDGRQRNVTDTEDNRLEHSMRAWRGESEPKRDYSVGDRWQGFPTVSPVHRGNDGLPFDVDDLTIPFAQWRTESLKAYGNAIVPQVMYEIFRAIELTTKKQ